MSSNMKSSPFLYVQICYFIYAQSYGMFLSTLYVIDLNKVSITRYWKIA